MCPPCLRAHTRVRPYKNFNGYIYDATLGTKTLGL